jgi:hypothetical protein
LGKKIFTTEAQSFTEIPISGRVSTPQQGIKRLILGSDSAVPSKKED